MQTFTCVSARSLPNSNNSSWPRGYNTHFGRGPTYFLRLFHHDPGAASSREVRRALCGTGRGSGSEGLCRGSLGDWSQPVFFINAGNTGVRWVSPSLYSGFWAVKSNRKIPFPPAKQRPETSPCLTSSGDFPVLSQLPQAVWPLLFIYLFVISLVLFDEMFLLVVENLNAKTKSIFQSWEIFIIWCHYFSSVLGSCVLVSFYFSRSIILKPRTFTCLCFHVEFVYFGLQGDKWITYSQKWSRLFDFPVRTAWRTGVACEGPA